MYRFGAMGRYPRRGRTAVFDASADIRVILERLRGQHGPAAGYEGGVWLFATLLGLMAAGWVVWLVRDLSEGYVVELRWVWGLAVAVFAVVVVVFFVLKTHSDRYEFEAAQIICWDGQGELRWKLAVGEIREVILVRVRGRRFFLYLVDDAHGRKHAVHSHESIARALRDCPLVQQALL